MKVIDLFCGRRNREDNEYKTEIIELISDFIAEREVEILHHIEVKDRQSLETEIDDWLSSKIIEETEYDGDSYEDI